MSTEVKHTPTPWRYIPEDNIIVHEYTGRLADIAIPRSLCVSEAERNANGDFICRCVNSHEALVAACEASLREFSLGVTEARGVDVLIQLRAAIKLAKGGGAE